KYQVTPEMLLHRMTNLLPKFFQLPQLFFLRFSHQAGRFSLTKEMHLAGLHNPHGSALGEHYCRRWVSLTLLQELEEAIEKQHYEAPLVDAQISNYYDSANEYLVFSIARPMTPTPSLSNSVSIGILLTEEVKERIGFLNSLPVRKVGETCERCSATDCEVRMASPIVLHKQAEASARKEALATLFKL
ncbi:MAG: XRE family transcriptional regulator, partial [Bacteroidota bacterium]